MSLADLERSCRIGDIKAVKSAISKGVDPRKSIWPDWTPLQIACKYNHLDLVKFLAEGKLCNLEAKDRDGRTPHHIAASEGNVEIFKYLIEVQGCSATTTDNNKWIPLHDACRYNHLDLVKFLAEGKHCNLEAKSRDGLTPLHVAVSEGNVETVKYLIEDQGCSAKSPDDNEWTPLHSASRNNHLDLVKFLAEGKHCNLEAKDRNGQTPLHVAVRYNNVEIVKYLTEVQGCLATTADNNKWTPLHDACSSNNLDIIALLVKGKHCDLNAKDKDGETPVHYAMRYNILDVIWLLVQGEHCNVDAKNKDDETLLHYAARNNHLDLVKYLAERKHCNLKARNRDGRTPLHVAARYGRVEIVNYLMAQGCSATTKDNNELTPLHSACRNNHLILVKFLAEETNCNLEAKDRDGQTLLHVAASHGRLNLVRFLMKGEHCNPDDKDNQGRTPLHLAAQNNELDVVRFLVEGRHCNLEAKDKDGETPLHYAVKMSYNNDKQIVECRRNTRMIECLLGDGQCDPNCSTRSGQTLLDMTNNTEKIRLLLNYGTKPTSYFPTRLQESPDAAVNMFVLGDPGAGKSTLVKAVSSEGNVFARVMNWFSQVTDVDENTAGIIPHEICSESLGRVNVYDFAGHREYYAGHDALLQNSMRGSPSIVTLVIDFSEEEDKIREKIQYWLQFISNHSSDSGPNPHLLVVGSHAENLSAKESREKSILLQSVIISRNLSGFSFIGNIMMDCRYGESTSMSQLRLKLSESCKSLRSSSEMPVAHHSFLVFLLHRFRKEVAVKLGEASAEMTKHLNSSQYIYLECAKSYDPLEICIKLNNRGNILFMRNHERPQESWIIFNKGALLSQVNGVIFAPGDFKEHKKLSSDSGIVPLTKLVSIFPKLHSDMITQFLCHLEFCHEVTDPEVLTLLHVSSKPTERLLFFPGLVKLSIPSNVWQPNDQFGYHSGWLLKCLKPEQFFNPRFLQVLLLRVAYSLAFASSAADSHVLPRNCRVWKCGMSWSHGSGIEIVVEIVNNKQVIAVMRCFKSHFSTMELLRTRSTIIRMVLNTKEELCSNVDVQESFLHPESVNRYPPTTDLRNLCHIVDVTQAVVEGNPCVVDENLQMVELDVLLHYEPFAKLGKKVIKLFYNDIYVTDEIIKEIAEKLHEKTHNLNSDEKINEVSAVLGVAQSEVGSLQSKVHRLSQVFRQWRDKQGAEGTLVNLRKSMERFSVFAGRSPLKVGKNDHSSNTLHPSAPHLGLHVPTSLTNGEEKMQISVKSGQIIDPDSLFNDLSLDIHHKYIEVGIALGLQYKVMEDELETGYMLMQQGSKKAMKMLQLWRDHVDEDDFTYFVLATALEKQGFQSYAHKYCYNVPSTGDTSPPVPDSTLPQND